MEIHLCMEFYQPPWFHPHEMHCRPATLIRRFPYSTTVESFVFIWRILQCCHFVVFPSQFLRSKTVDNRPPYHQMYCQNRHYLVSVLVVSVKTMSVVHTQGQFLSVDRYLRTDINTCTLLLQAVRGSWMYRNAVQGRTMLCSIIELIHGGLYLELGCRYSFGSWECRRNWKCCNNSLQ